MPCVGACARMHEAGIHQSARARWRMGVHAWSRHTTICMHSYGCSVMDNVDVIHFVVALVQGPRCRFPAPRCTPIRDGPPLCPCGHTSDDMKEHGECEATTLDGAHYHFMKWRGHVRLRKVGPLAARVHLGGLLRVGLLHRIQDCTRFRMLRH